MIEDERLRVENAPEHILEYLTPGVRATCSAMNGSHHLSNFPLIRRMHERGHEEAPSDFFVGQRRFREPVIESSVFARDLVLDSLPADQVHGLGNIGRIIALANHFTSLQ